MKIEVQNLEKKFKNNTILSDVNLEFTSGHIYGLAGRNGSGKSAFFKILCGLYKPTLGIVLFNGKNYHLDNMFVPNLRALIEKPSFFPDLTGYENLELLAKIQNKISSNEILSSLKRVNLIEEKDKLYKEYSLGMKQKLGIAQVIMENPDILILDEPFNGIEEEMVKKISNYLLELKHLGKLIIISSHIKEDLNYLCDEIYYFDNGKVQQK